MYFLIRKQDIVKNRLEAASRALKEAQDRKTTKINKKLPKELGGRDGPEPTRYGDWEKKGIVTDF